MKITRDVALDLWPLVEAGEASADSKAIVEEFARQDAEFSRILEGGRKLNSLSRGAAPALPSDHQKQTLDATRRHLRRRSWYLAGALFFLGWSGSFGFSSKEGIIWSMWRDQPAVAAVSLAVSILFWFLYARSAARIRAAAR